MVYLSEDTRKDVTRYLSKVPKNNSYTTWKNVKPIFCRKRYLSLIKKMLNMGPTLPSISSKFFLNIFQSLSQS